MQLQTILNRVERHKSFVYKTVRFANGDRAALEVLSTNAPMAGPSALAAINLAPATTGCPSGVMNSCRCGRWRYSWCTPRGASLAQIAV